MRRSLTCSLAGTGVREVRGHLARNAARQHAAANIHSTSPACMAGTSRVFTTQTTNTGGNPRQARAAALKTLGYSLLSAVQRWIFCVFYGVKLGVFSWFSLLYSVVGLAKKRTA